MAQFSHWTDQEIIERFLDGMSMIRLSKMTGKTVRKIKMIVTMEESA